MVRPFGPIGPLQFDLLGPETLPLLLVISGLGLALAEALAPGAHFIVLGVALLAAGLLGLVLGAFATPLVLGVLVFVFGALALYGYREFDLYGGSATGQTKDSDSLKGKIGRVTERVTPTSGEIKLTGGGFNPYYAARSFDGEIAEGSEVMVIDPGGGNVVTVESLEIVEDEIDRELAREREARAYESAQDRPDQTDRSGQDDRTDRSGQDDRTDRAETEETDHETERERT